MEYVEPIRQVGYYGYAAARLAAPYVGPAVERVVEHAREYGSGYLAGAGSLAAGYIGDKIYDAVTDRDTYGKAYSYLRRAQERRAARNEGISLSEAHRRGLEENLRRRQARGESKPKPMSWASHEGRKRQRQSWGSLPQGWNQGPPPRLRPALPLYPIVGHETKYFEVTGTGSVTAGGADWSATEVGMSSYINSSGAAAVYTDCCLLPTAQGTSYGQVAGQRYVVEKIRVRGTLHIDPHSAMTAVQVAPQVRVLMVMDTSPCGAQAQGEDIMQDYGGAQVNFHSFQRMATNTGRFRVLKDKNYVFSAEVAANNAAATTISQSFRPIPFKMSYKPRGLRVEIANGNATPTVAGTVSHNIFLLIFGIQDTGVETVEYRLVSRCYFKG